MIAQLRIKPSLHDDLMDHLLSPDVIQEQAAFLFASRKQSGHQVLFEVTDSFKPGATDYAYQEGDYLELADRTRAHLIKRAHDLKASLVEIHSHPGPWPAAFSVSDRVGLRETVLHMWWRLKGRPYLAIVVSNSGFDALLWLDNPRVPRSLDGLLVGNFVRRPTNNSLHGWK